MIRTTRIHWLLFLPAFVPHQEGTGDWALSASPFDHVLALELKAGDSQIDARGAAAVVEYEVEFSGTLHLWSKSDSDLILEVQDPNSGNAIAEDDDSGGGTAPYLALRVEPGRELVLRVLAKEGSEATAELSIAGAPESQATRTALENTQALIQELHAMQQRGEHDSARELLSLFQAELEAVEGAKQSEAVALARRKLGMTAWSLGALESCVALWEAAAAHILRTRPPDHLKSLQLIGNLGLALMQTGRRAEAAVLHERVAEACQRTLPPEHPDVLVALVNLAIARKESGDLFGAEALERRVLDVFERTRDADDSQLLALTLNHGVTLLALGDLPGARALFERALAGCERTMAPGQPELLRARSNLASVLGELDELEAAREQLLRLLADGEGKRPPDDFDLVRARLNLANVSLWLGDHEDALELFDDTLEVLEEQLSEDDPVLSMARLNRAVSLGAMGRRSEAIDEIRTVITVFELVFPEDHSDQLQARLALLRLLLEEGSADEARENARVLVDGLRRRAMTAFALAPREAQESLATDAHLLPWIIAVAELDEGLGSALFELIETRRQVASASGRGAALIARDRDLGGLVRGVGRARSALQAEALRTEQDETAAERAERIARSSMERDLAQRTLRRGLLERGLVAETMDAEALARSLPANAVALSYLRCPAVGARSEDGRLPLAEDRLYGHVLVPGGKPIRVDLGTAVELERLVASWRETLGAPILRGVVLGDPDNGAPDQMRERTAGVALRERLLDPLLAHAGAQADLLLVCADDIVHLVPLDALPKGEVRVGDEWRIALQRSFAEVAPGGAAPDSDPSLLVLGAPDFSRALTKESSPSRLATASKPGLRSSPARRFAPLLQTSFEIQSVGALFELAYSKEAVVLSKEDATKEALFERAPGARFLHLATHGWFAPESERSLLDEPVDAKGEQRLRLEQMVKGFAPMTLSGLALAGANQGGDSLGHVRGLVTAEEMCSLDLSQCQLAVLSACETNVGIRRAGQGIQSLQSALHSAGARTAITSLWKVDDAATRRLMELFYTYLWEEKQPVADALWNAKLDLRASDHPLRDWAGWVLSGDPE